jgi:hypothetical protein
MPDLQRPPEIIRIKVARELGVDIHNVNVSFCGVADNGFVVLAGCGVGFYVDAECSV